MLHPCCKRWNKLLRWNKIVNDGTALDTIPDDTTERSRPVMVKLLKTSMRGGILTLTNRELVLGEGILGTQHIRRFPLRDFVRLDVLPSPNDRGLRRNQLLRVVWIDGQVTDVDGVGPVAAQRIEYVLQAIRRPAMRQYVA